MGIGEKIKVRRKELGISQEELAKRIGYADRSIIAKMEIGRYSNPSISRVERIAKALEVSPAYIAGWKD